MNKFDELSNALKDCRNDSNCDMVTDIKCDGGFWTCSGTLKASKTGSCTWVKDGGK